MTSLTTKDVEAVILRALGPDVKIVNHTLEPFAKLKTGCLGSHLLLTVRFKRASDVHEDTKTFFVKSMPESQIIVDVLMDQSMFEDEINFYQNVAPLLMEENSGERWFPKCYLISADALVFEDLKVQGYAIQRNHILDESLMKAALTSLAGFHASTILAEHRLGKTLQELFPNAFVEKLFATRGNFSKTVQVGFKTIRKIMERFDVDSSIVPKIEDRIFKLTKMRKGKCNVLCHGDLWINNLMFKDNNSIKCILIDYQFLRYTSPFVDVAMLVYLHTAVEYRKKSEFDLFKHYYWLLHDALSTSRSKPPIPSYEDMLSDYEDCRLIGMTFGLLYLPGMFLPSDELAKIMNDPEILKKWSVGDRFDIIGFHLNTNPIYEKKLKNLVFELVEEAKLVFET